MSYQDLVQQINTLHGKIRDRVKRCNYLKTRAKEYAIVNPEQAEAFSIRFNKHKPILIKQLKEIEKLEATLKSTSHIHIS